MTARTASPPLWGVAAEFAGAEGVVAALRALGPRRFGRLDAFTPVPLPEAAALIGIDQRPLPWLAAAGAVAGAAAMFAMCTYATIWGYRFDIGGRPLFSWPSFVVPAVSAGALAAAALSYAALLVLNRLPRLNHPAFNIPRFSRVTADGWFVAVEANEPDFDPAAVEAALRLLATRPLHVSRVPR